jgi:hypothetical protein
MALRSSRAVRRNWTSCPRASSVRCSRRRSIMAFATALVVERTSCDGKHCRYCSSIGSNVMAASRSPHHERFRNPSRMVVFRAKVTSATVIAGVMTATRSSGPSRRSSICTSGCRIEREALCSTCKVSRNRTKTRARGFCRAARDSAVVAGSLRASWGALPRIRMRSNCSIFCGVPSSRMRTSSCRRSGTGAPSRVVGKRSTRT